MWVFNFSLHAKESLVWVIQTGEKASFIFLEAYLLLFRFGRGLLGLGLALKSDDLYWLALDI